MSTAAISPRSMLATSRSSASVGPAQPSGRAIPVHAVARKRVDSTSRRRKDDPKSFSLRTVFLLAEAMFGSSPWLA
jgi:hypothetical protein